MEEPSSLSSGCSLLLTVSGRKLQPRSQESTKDERSHHGVSFSRRAALAGSTEWPWASTTWSRRRTVLPSWALLTSSCTRAGTRSSFGK